MQGTTHCLSTSEPKIFRLILRIFPLMCFLKKQMPLYGRNVHGKISEMQISSSSSLPLLSPSRKNALTSSWLPSWNGLVTFTFCLQEKSKVNTSLQGREPHNHNPLCAKEAGGKPCAGSQAAGLAKRQRACVLVLLPNALGVLPSHTLPSRN